MPEMCMPCITEYEVYESYIHFRRIFFILYRLLEINQIRISEQIAFSLFQRQIQCRLHSKC